MLLPQPENQSQHEPCGRECVGGRPEQPSAGLRRGARGPSSGHETRKKTQPSYFALGERIRLSLCWCWFPYYKRGPQVGWLKAPAFGVLIANSPGQMWLLCKQLNTDGFSLLTFTTSIDCQSQATGASHLTVPFLVVSEKISTCYQKELLVPWFLIATIHPSRDILPVWPHSDHCAHTILLCLYNSLFVDAWFVASPSVHALQALMNPRCPPTLQPHSSFVSGKK